MPAAALAGAQMVGGGLQAYGSISEGREKKAAGEMNAGIEEDNALFAEQAGEDRALQIIRMGDEARSTTRARGSASGLVVDTGSALLVQEEAVREAAIGANKERYAGHVQAAGDRSRARLYRMSGQQAAVAGHINAVTTLVGAATKAGGAYTAK